MTASNFAFNPTDGLRNAVSFPTTPVSEADARNQPQTLLDQLRDYINNTIITELNNKLALTGGNLTGDLSTTGKITASGTQTGSALIATGLTGATSASRYVGATANGAPINGTFNKGDYMIDHTGALWVCTAAGSPGTWNKVGGAENTALSLSGSYTGDGVANRLITVGFTPKIVMLSTDWGGAGYDFGISTNTNAAGRLWSATTSANLSTTVNAGEASNAGDAAQPTTNGFLVGGGTNNWTNGTGKLYNWVAIG